MTGGPAGSGCGRGICCCDGGNVGAAVVAAAAAEVDTVEEVDALAACRLEEGDCAEEVPEPPVAAALPALRCRSDAAGRFVPAGAPDDVGVGTGGMPADGEGSIVCSERMRVLESYVAVALFSSLLGFISISYPFFFDPVFWFGPPA